MDKSPSIKDFAKKIVIKSAAILPNDIREATGLRKYIHNTAWLFAEKILRLILGVLIVMWVARYLGPSDFGLLNYALSFVGLFSAIASLGIDNVLVRQLTLNPQNHNELIASAFAIKLFGSVVAIISLVSVCAIINSTRDIRFLIYIAAFSLLIHPLLIFEFYFRSIVRSHYFAWAMITALFVGALLRLVFIRSRLSLPYFVAVPSVELMVVAVVLIIFYLKQSKSLLVWRVKIETAKALLKDSWPLLFSGAMVSIYMRIDQVMIQNMIDSQALGYYSAAVRISEAWYFIPVVICQSVFPSIVSTREFDVELHDKRFQLLFNFMVLISLTIAIPMSLFADELLSALYGSAYEPAAGVFQIHIWSGIFVSLGVAGSNWLLAENLQRYYLANVFIGALINVLLNILLIHFFSFYGAAIATIISYCVSSYLGLLFFKKTRPCFIKMSRSFLFYKWFTAGY